MDMGPWETFWSVCTLAALVAAVPAVRSRRWRYVGRAAVGLLFLVGGALYNAVQLASGSDYADFADPAHFAWVTDAWRAVVPPHVAFFIGLLVAFEASAGALILSGGRRTQLGYLGVVGFCLAVWLFGGFQLVWAAIMLPPLLLLLRAERRAATAPTPPPAAQAGEKPLADVGS